MDLNPRNTIVLPLARVVICWFGPALKPSSHGNALQHGSVLSSPSDGEAQQQDQAE